MPCIRIGRLGTEFAGGRFAVATLAVRRWRDSPAVSRAAARSASARPVMARGSGLVVMLNGSTITNYGRLPVFQTVPITEHSMVYVG